MSDSRPEAWFETGRICTREPERIATAEWLEGHFTAGSGNPELVVKDPRLSWFLALWRVAAIRTGARPVFATMLRPPAEVVGSKQTYYANRLGSAHLAASWLNMLLHTERGTRESGVEGGRVFVRYGDLLDDWTRATMHVGETLQLQHVLHAKSEAIRDGHRFVDPSLRRMSQSLDDLALPPRLHELVADTWTELNKLAEPGGDTPEVHTALDQLREALRRPLRRGRGDLAVLGGRGRAADEEGRQGEGGLGRLDQREPPGVGELDQRGRQDPARRPGCHPAEPAARAAQGGRPLPMTAHSGPGGIRNLEGHTDFDITWPWTRPGGLRPGTTVVLRVKNEAPSLPFVLPPLLRACDSVLLVDNGSTDGTPEVAVAAAAEHGRPDKLTVASYPFDVARAGAEHLAQHELSVHSLSYFYNWCFAQVRTRYSWKWDGDMVLTTEGEASMADLGWQVGDVQSIIRVPRHGLYLDGDAHGYLDLGLRNAEEWGFPIGPDFVYTKAFEWEIRTTPERCRSIGLPHGLCVELKYLDGDEFAHWTDPSSFATSWRNKRKRREWEVFNALLEATVLPGVHEIHAPPGVHIVDHVTHDWLPRAPRPLQVGLG